MKSRDKVDTLTVSLHSVSNSCTHHVIPAISFFVNHNIQEEIRIKFQLDPQQNITLLHSGADLSGPWIVRDVGIPYGASIHCKLREKEPIPTLHIMLVNLFYSSDIWS